jgi:uncharacterized protein YecE (DUF72 family)
LNTQRWQGFSEVAIVKVRGGLGITFSRFSSMRKGKIYIGTSGWSYKHWKHTFYPEGTKNADHFSYYQRHFNTVELNNSFYMLPPPETFTTWNKSTPSKFIFAVKASRFFTHMKKLIVDREGIIRFFTSVDQLGTKLGPILFQLPPKWKINAPRLAEFIAALPKGYRYTFEFREHSWYNDEVYAILRKNNCAFCIYELEFHLSPTQITADFVYIRLHGPGYKYQGSYTDAKLSEWAQQLQAWQKAGKDVYIYFDNDQEGYAAFNAITLQKLVTTGQLRR